MGLLDGVKKAAAKTKLQGDLLLLDREIENVKKKHGVFIYDVLFQRHHAGEKADLPLEGLEAAFVAAMEDMADLLAKKLEKDQEKDDLTEKEVAAQSERQIQEESAGERAKHAGKTIQNIGTTTKLKAEMAYYSREMRVRKEIFGVQVFDDLRLMEHTERFADDDVGTVLNVAKNECAVLLERKKEKESELASMK